MHSSSFCQNSVGRAFKAEGAARRKPGRYEKRKRGGRETSGKTHLSTVRGERPARRGGLCGWKSRAGAAEQPPAGRVVLQLGEKSGAKYETGGSQRDPQVGPSLASRAGPGPAFPSLPPPPPSWQQVPWPRAPGLGGPRGPGSQPAGRQPDAPGRKRLVWAWGREEAPCRARGGSAIHGAGRTGAGRGREPARDGAVSAGASAGPEPRSRGRGAGAPGFYAASTPAGRAGIPARPRALCDLGCNAFVSEPRALSRGCGETRGCGGGPRGGSGPSQLQAGGAVSQMPAGRACLASSQPSRAREACTKGRTRSGRLRERSFQKKIGHPESGVFLSSSDSGVPAPGSPLASRVMLGRVLTFS